MRCARPCGDVLTLFTHHPRVVSRGQDENIAPREESAQAGGFGACYFQAPETGDAGSFTVDSVHWCYLLGLVVERGAGGLPCSGKAGLSDHDTPDLRLGGRLGFGIDPAGVAIIHHVTSRAACTRASEAMFLAKHILGLHPALSHSYPIRLELLAMTP